MEGPSTKWLFLGIEVDSAELVFLPPTEKLNKLTQLIVGFLNVKRVTARQQKRSGLDCPMWTCRGSVDGVLRVTLVTFGRS